jgi:hypothetical protein
LRRFFQKAASFFDFLLRFCDEVGTQCHASGDDLSFLFIEGKQLLGAWRGLCWVPLGIERADISDCSTKNNDIRRFWPCPGAHQGGEHVDKISNQ